MKKINVGVGKVLMYSPWTRTHTQDWIAQLENRIEDIDYYLSRTVEYCENNGIWDDIKVFSISFVVVIWVCKMREEKVTRQEILELLGMEHFNKAEDAVINLSEHLADKDFEELLQILSDISQNSRL